MSVTTKILDKLSHTQKGSVLFVSDFSELGNNTAIRQSLLRITKKAVLIRIANGIYYYPKQSELFGVVMPTTEQLAIAIAKRDKARIIPTGSFALYKLGLSTQIPLNVVYLTDGSARKIQIDKQEITFKKTSPKNLAVTHYLSNIIIQALKELGEHNITEQEIQQIKNIIEKSKEITELKNNIINAPVWIQEIVFKIIKQIEE